MKITAIRLENFLRQPDPSLRCFLVYGPDHGLVRETADRLALNEVEELQDPFRVVDITANTLKDDPARLADEANALSLSGGNRVLRIRDATDNLADLFKQFIDTKPYQALIVIEAASLKARSPLRKIFESAKNAATIPCYEDNERSLRDVIQKTLAKYELSVAPDALPELIASLGSDRLLSRSELEKLALYKGNPGTITIEDVHACIGDNAITSLDGIINATFNGERSTLDQELRRSYTEGLTSVSILRATGRHLQRLHLAGALITNGNNPQQAMKALRPPVFFKQEDNFRRQLMVWNNDKITTALSLVSAAELDCKSTGLPDQAICGRTLMRIAQAARR